MSHSTDDPDDALRAYPAAEVPPARTPAHYAADDDRADDDRADDDRADDDGAGADERPEATLGDGQPVDWSSDALAASTEASGAGVDPASSWSDVRTSSGGYGADDPAPHDATAYPEYPAYPAPQGQPVDRGYPSAGDAPVPAEYGAPPAPPATSYPEPHPEPSYPETSYPAPPYPAPGQQPPPSYQPGPPPSQPYPTYQTPGYGAPDQNGYPGQPRPAMPVPQQALHQAAPMPPPPAAPPKPEDLLVPDQSPVNDEPASWGWRGRMHRASGGLIKSKPKAAELQVRQSILDIQRSFSRPMTVVVVQPKGGAGKTPTTVCLAAAFGSNRGGYVVGWDDNETRGTLAVRVSNPDSKQATVWDLLSDLAAFERFDARVGDLSFYVRSQPDAHFDALVSDDNPSNMSQIGDDEFQRLHRVLQRFYRMIVVDTGNNVRSPNWQAAVNAADLVVVVSSYQRDVGYSASWVLDHLAQTGREELARNAVTVLTAADPTTDKVVRQQLLDHFRSRTRAVIEIPYDSELAHGGPIRWTELGVETRHAWIQAGAVIANCLAEHDQRAIAARRT